jgi:hypothetical protein
MNWHRRQPLGMAPGDRRLRSSRRSRGHYTPGGDAGEAMTRLLKQAGVTLHRLPRTGPGTDSAAGGPELYPDRIVTLPASPGRYPRHPRLCLDRFLHVDGSAGADTDGVSSRRGRDRPSGQGGEGSAAAADTAAAGIAHLAGAAGNRPVIRGMLPRTLAAHSSRGEAGWPRSRQSPGRLMRRWSRFTSTIWNAQGRSRRPASSVLEPRDTKRIHRSVAGGAFEQADAIGCLGSAPPSAPRMGWTS